MNQPKTYLFLLALFAYLLFAACEKEVTLDLPEYTSELVVESYIEADFPYLLVLTESIPFFDSRDVALVEDALVTITHKNITDTLHFVDTLGFYLNLEREVVANDFEPFYLRVEDTKGRVVTSQTQFLPKPAIDTITYSFNDSLKASVVLFFSDKAEEQNWYKVFFGNANNLTDTDSTFTWEFPDEVFAGQRTLSGVGFSYEVEDTVLVRLYNIEEAYYQFLEAVDAAEDAVQNPIVRPARLTTNIEGGQGIFTALSFDERVFVIEEEE